MSFVVGEGKTRRATGNENDDDLYMHESITDVTFNQVKWLIGWGPTQDHANQWLGLIISSLS